MENKESEYEYMVEPLLNELKRICDEHGIAIFAICQSSDERCESLSVFNRGKGHHEVFSELHDKIMSCRK